MPLQPVFRFAPSPNGALHLGHAYSALLNQNLARERGGRFLLRIEDIDTIRCRPELVDACLEDLRWLGLVWEQPVLRQSSQFSRYSAALAGLERDGLVYPCFCSRKQIVAGISRCESVSRAPWPRDPDSVPHYPGTCRALGHERSQARIAAGEAFALRLDSAVAAQKIAGRALVWTEADQGSISADFGAWGDVVLGRKEMPTSYHLAVVLDDSLQGVTDVVRGIDLFAATSIHRLLQELLGLPAPRYRHHRLVSDEQGQKLAKSRSSTPLRQLREQGMTPQGLRMALGFA